MAEKDKKSSSTKLTAQSPKDFPLSLDEFCTRLSQNDKRVELIGGFYAAEKMANHLSDTEVNFMKRLNMFEKQPMS